MAENDVEIHVRVKDESAPGWTKVRARQRDELGRFTKDSERGGDEAGRGFASRFGKAFGGGDSSGMVGGVVGKLKSSLTSALQPTAVALATGFSAQFTGQVVAGLASGAAKMAHGLGAVAALLPAAALAGVAAFASLKIAVLGVGDAMGAALTGDTKAFGEAIKGLSPAAKSFAHEIRGMRGEIDGLRQGVQQDFFSKFAGDAGRLGATYLPMVREALGGIAGSFGKAVHESARFLELPNIAEKLGGSLGNVRVAVGNVAGILPDLVRAFTPLITVGSTFLPQLSGGLRGAASGFADFMAHAERSGKLAGFIQGGLDKLRSLWETAKQLVRIFRDVVGIGSKLFAGASLSGGRLLDQIEKLADAANRFFETKKGSKILAQVLEILKGLAVAFMGTLQKLAGMIAPFLPQIAAFATAFANLKTAILDAIEPAVEILLGKLLPALTSLMEWVTRNKPVLQGLLIGLFAAWAASAGAAAVATLLAALPFIALGVAIAALAALVIIHFDTIKRWISNVFNWVKANWPLLLLMLTGPFGAAVALIKIHWDSIVEFVKKLPGRIWSAAKGMWNGITDGLAGVIDFVWDQIRSLIRAYNAIPFAPDVPISSNAKLGRMAPKPVARGGGGSTRPMAHGGIGGGLRRVAERGRELLELPSGEGVVVGMPQGTRVHPNGATETMLGGGGQPPVINIYIAGSLRSDRDLVEIIRNEFNRGGFGGLGR